FITQTRVCTRYSYISLSIMSKPSPTAAPFLRRGLSRFPDCYNHRSVKSDLAGRFGRRPRSKNILHGTLLPSLKLCGGSAETACAPQNPSLTYVSKRRLVQ